MKILNIVRDGKGRIIRAWDKYRIKCFCKVCRKEFETIESKIKIGKGKFCSRKCFNLFPKSPQWKEKQSKNKKGKHVSLSTEFKKGNIPFNKGTEFKQIQWNNHWNWKGGRTRYVAFIKRQKILNRCGKCGKVENFSHKLHVHHKDMNRNNNELSNLEILCSTCHAHFHANWLKRKY